MTSLNLMCALAAIGWRRRSRFLVNVTVHSEFADRYRNAARLLYAGTLFDQPEFLYDCPSESLDITRQTIRLAPLPKP